MSTSRAGAPVLRYLLFFIPGMIAGDLTDLPFTVPLLLLGLNILLILIYGKKKAPLILFMSCIALTGMMRAATARQQFLQKVREPFRGEFHTDIRVLEQKTTPARIQYYIVETDTGGARVRATLYRRNGMPVLMPGKRYGAGPLGLELIPPQRNPGGFDYRNYARTKGISHRLVTDDRTRFRDKGVDDPLRYAAFRVRNDMSKRFLAVLGIEKGSMVNGFLMGMRSGIPACISGRFRDLGISHLLAVSGLHVGLIVLIVYRLLLICGLPGTLRSLLICVFLYFYCYLSGASPSVIRAALMTSLVLCAAVLQRRCQALNTVAATALILLMFDPFYIRDVGFQFSFSAVFGILCGYRALERKIPFRPASPLLKYVYEMLLVSASAALFTAPAALMYFNTLQLGSIFLNIIAIPLTFCVMITAMLGIPCVYFPSLLSDLVLNALDMLLSFLRGLLRLASGSGIWTWTVSSYWKPLVSAAVLIPALCLILPAGKLRKCFGICILCTALLWFWWNGRPELVQFALERGNAVVFRNHREALIINTGARGFNRNDYEDAIRPLLESRGVSSVTVVIGEWKKQNTGTIADIRRDFPDCGLFLPPVKAECELSHTVIGKDTAWTMGRQRVELHPRGECLELTVRIRGRDVHIGRETPGNIPHIDTDAGRSRALRMVFYGKSVRRTE